MRVTQSVWSWASSAYVIEAGLPTEEAEEDTVVMPELKVEGLGV
jgi:hypothetical protein